MFGDDHFGGEGADDRAEEDAYGHEKNADDRLPVASTQKLLTAMEVIAEGELEQDVQVTIWDQLQPPTKLGLIAGTSHRRLDLLRPADLAPKDGSGGPGVVVPLDVETARAPGTALRPGSVVTVLATDPDSTGTVTVAPAATVVAVDATDESLGTSTTRHVRLRVATPAAAAGLVDAAVRSTITLTVPSAISDGSQE